VPAAAPGLFPNVGELLENARVAVLMDKALQNWAARKRLAPVLEQAQKIIEEIEALRVQHEAKLQRFIAQPWDAWLAHHPAPETRRQVERALVPAGEALKLMRLVPGQLRWALDESTRLRPAERDTQEKRIRWEVQKVGSAVASIRENIARSENALAGLEHELRRHGFRDVALTGGEEVPA
jgi:predicted metal-dependent phosphoesterase TrpH